MPAPRGLESGHVDQILWLSDLSENAARCEHAVRWFATLATTAGDEPAEVLVAHALGADAGEPPSLEDSRRAEAMAHLAGLAGDLDCVGIHAHPVVVRGRPWDVARTLVDEHEVDLVIVGRTGVTGMDRVLLGSTARRVMRELQVPILVVHDAEFTAPRRIVCPVDPTSASMAAASDSGIRLAAALGRASGAQVTFVSVALATGFVPEDRDEVGRALDAKVATVLGQRAEGLTHSTRVIIAQDVAEGVKEAAHKADLLVLGSAGRTGLARLVLGSVAEDLVAHCPVNTLVAH